MSARPYRDLVEPPARHRVQQALSRARQIVRVHTSNFGHVGLHIRTRCLLRLKCGHDVKDRRSSWTNSG